MSKVPYPCPHCEQPVPAHQEHPWAECSGNLRRQIEILRGVLEGVGQSLWALSNGTQEEYARRWSLKWSNDIKRWLENHP